VILGMWLGAAVSVDVLVAQNFSAIDRFLAAPGTPGATAQVRQTGTKSLRFLLRRNAAEENASIFEVWEWTQIGIATGLFLFILFGERPPGSVLIAIPGMMLILLLQRFLLTPHVASLGREVDEIPAQALFNNPIVSRFWAFHGFYAGGEILKLIVGMGVASRLMIRRDSRATDSNTRDSNPRDLNPREIPERAAPERSSARRGSSRRKSRHTADQS